MAGRPCLSKAGPFAIALACTSAIAEEVADKPELRVGDQILYQQSGSDNGRSVERRWRRRIVERLPDGMFRVEPRMRNIDVFDGSWNHRHPERPDFWPIDFKFPLRVGDAWSYSSPPGARDNSGLSYWQHGHHKVVAFETITVPAGTFGCFRLEGESMWTSGTYLGHPNWSYNERWRMTRWYCPDVKYVAKMDIQIDRFGTTTGALHSALHSELVSYKQRDVAMRPKQPSKAERRTSPVDPDDP